MAAFTDGQYKDPKNCPKSDDGKCQACVVPLEQTYGIGSGYGFGVYSVCPKCASIYDFFPDEED